MIPVEVAQLRDILLNDINATNSESQATKWASQIIEILERSGYVITHESNIDGG